MREEERHAGTVPSGRRHWTYLLYHFDVRRFSIRVTQLTESVTHTLSRKNGSIERKNPLAVKSLVPAGFNTAKS